MKGGTGAPERNRGFGSNSGHVMLLVGIGLGLGLQFGAGISILRVLPAVRLIATILRHQAALSEVCALLSTASAFF